MWVCSLVREKVDFPVTLCLNRWGVPASWSLWRCLKCWYWARSMCDSVVLSPEASWGLWRSLFLPGFKPGNRVLALNTSTTTWNKIFRLEKRFSSAQSIKVLSPSRLYSHFAQWRKSSEPARAPGYCQRTPPGKKGIYHKSYSTTKVSWHHISFRVRIKIPPPSFAKNNRGHPYLPFHFCLRTDSKAVAQGLGRRIWPTLWPLAT
jgi:hypothetical protein